MAFPKSPLVSVIIPCHNRGNALIECLDSLRSQSYPSIEVVVVDDASSENIPDIIRAVAWPKSMVLHYLRSEANVGPGRARELGRLAAVGDYVCYQDSDDWWHPEKIEAQVKVLRQNPDAGMCYCIAREFGSLPVIGNEPVRYRSDHAFSHFLPMLLEMRRRPWGSGACMWTREAVDRIGPWFPGWTWEDMEYDCRAGCHDISIVHLPRSLCYYRSSTGDYQLRTQDWRSRTLQAAESIQAIGDALQQNNKLVDGRLRRAYSRLLFDHSIMLLRMHADHQAMVFLRRAKGLTDKYPDILWSTQVVMSILEITRSTRMAWLVGRCASSILARLSKNG